MNYATIFQQAGAALKAIVSGRANELVYDEEPGQTPDALKFRFGTRGSDRMACITIDRISGYGDNTTRRELGYIKFGHDDNYPKDVDVACVEISLTKPGVDGDAGEVTVFRMGLKKGLEVLVGGVPVGAASDRIYSADGRYYTVQQGDGNLVTYDTVDGHAVWSSLCGGSGV